MHPLKYLEDLRAKYPEEEELILLGALSVCWLRPQNPSAAELLKRWQERQFSMEPLREAALQLFLVAGFQVSLEAFFQIDEVFAGSLPSACERIKSDSAIRWHERGLSLQQKVYARNTEKLRKNLMRVSPELSQWTVLVGYGLVLSRPGLNAGLRELLEVAVLALRVFLGSFIRISKVL